MAKSVIKVTVPVSIDNAFARLSDHANLCEISAPVKESYLEEKGSPEPNGLGAVRRLKFAGTWMIEKVVAWHPPQPGVDAVGYDYKVIGGGPPIADHLGTIRLTSQGPSQCAVEWIIYLRCPLWAGGELTAMYSCWSMQRSISRSVVNAFAMSV